MLNKSFVIILVGLLFGGTANAVSSESLSQLIQEATQHNPQIKAAYNRWLAAKAVIPQSWSLPDPKVEFGYVNMSGNSQMDEEPQREQMIGVSQEIPFPTKLYLRGKVSALDEKRAKAEYQATRFAVIAQLKKMYYDVYLINRSIEIFQKNQLLLEKIEKSTRVNYSVGKANQQDIFRAQTEISRLLMRLVMLRQERASQEADINRLLNRSLEMPVLTAPQLPVSLLHFDLNHFYRLVDSQAPKLQASKKNVEKSNQEVSLSKQDYFPDIEIGAGRLRDNAMDTQGYQVMLKATIPLYFASKQNYAVREKLARYHADLDDLYSAHRDLSFQVKNSFLLAQRSEALIHLIQHTIIPQATLTFTSSQASYSVGRVDFLTLLNNLLTLQDNELELQNEIVQHEKAIAQLEEITGIAL